MKRLYWICFWKFGSLDYNIWTIVPLAWLWLVQSVDTAQAHIYHIRNLPNLYKTEFLENLLTGFRGSGVSGVGAGHSGFPGHSGPSPETPGCKGIKTFDRGEKGIFHSHSVLTAPHLSRRLSPPPWAISTSNPPNLVKVRIWRPQGVEIKDLLKSQRVQVFSPLSQGIFKGVFPDLLP
jgi:hypothetical protein